MRRLAMLALSAASLGAIHLAQVVIRVPLPGISAASADTLWFGGTHWDAADARWEALQDSVWTFDTGVASAINTDPNAKQVGLHSIMEGWTGVDHTSRVSVQRFRRLSEAHFAGSPGICVGAATGVLGGNWSMWAGVTQSESDTLCFPGGQGYGNAWDITLSQPFAYTGGPVSLAFSYVNDTESTFDFTYVMIDTTGGGGDVVLLSLDGVTAGRDTISLVPGASLPSAPGIVEIKFRVRSDGSYSDEDGLYPTVCGAFAVDDIVLTGGITHSADFEEDQDGWDVTQDPGGYGDWTDLEAVADLPSESAASGCDLGDSVLVLIDYNAILGYHGCPQENVAVSPWIDLAGAGIVAPTGFVLEYGGYVRSSLFLFLLAEAQWYPDTCSISGAPRVSDLKWVEEYIAFPDTLCSSESGRVQIDFSALIPGDVDRVRVALGTVDSRQFFFCESPSNHNSTPWIDDVRFGVVQPTTTGVDDPTEPTPRVTMGPFVPNPFRGNGRAWLRYTTEEAGHVSLEIFDLAGRRVRTIVNQTLDASEHTAYWDGRTSSGLAAPSGVYFVRLVAGDDVASRKLLVIR